MTELKVHSRACDIERMVQNEKVRQAFALRLKKALSQAGQAEWGAGARLSEITGATAKAASKWLNADSMPGRANMLAIADWLGVRVEWLQYGEGEPAQPEASRTEPPNTTQEVRHKEGNVHAVDFSRPRIAKTGEILIPQYDVRASMGTGQELPSSYIDTIRHIAVSPDYLREAGVQYTAARNLAVITGFGESMHKTFSSGDPLIIDRGVNELVTDGVYLFSLAGMLYIKRLQLLPGKVRMISDNDAFPPYDIQGAELAEMIIHARVLLAWNARKL